MANKCKNFMDMARTYQYCEAVAGYDRTLLNLIFGSEGNGNNQYNNPRSSCRLSTGNFLIVDSANHRIQEVTDKGVYVGQFGSLGAGNSNFNIPVGVCRDGSDNIFVTDYANGAVKKFNSAYVYQTKIALATCQGIDCDVSTGAIYATSYGGNTLNRIDNALAGITHTIAGLSSPSGVCVNGSFVYYADRGNHRIGKAAIADLSGAAYMTGGVAGNALHYLYITNGVWFDSSGKMYAMNAGNLMGQIFNGFNGDFISQFGQEYWYQVGHAQPIPAFGVACYIANTETSDLICVPIFGGAVISRCHIVDLRPSKYIETADYTQALNDGFTLTSAVQVVLNTNLQGGTATIQASTDSGANWTTITNGDLSTVSAAFTASQKIRFRVTLTPSNFDMQDCRIYGIYMTYTDTEAYKEDMLPAINAFVLGGVM